MQSVVDTVASPWDASSVVSAVWRGLAKRAHESTAILSKNKVDESQRRTVVNHIAAMKNVIEMIFQKKSQIIIVILPPLENPGRNLRNTNLEKIVARKHLATNVPKELESSVT